MFPACQKSETPASSAAQSNFRFEVSFSPEVHSQPITGRVYIILSQNKKKEPRFQVSPTGVPFFGKNVHSLEPGKETVVDESVFGYPVESIGKLHVYTGTMDSYYLNNAVHFMEEFLEKTKNPYYEGTIEYGKRKPHCWGPRGQELIQLIAQQVTQNAPPPEETKSWKYK